MTCVQEDAAMKIEETNVHAFNEIIHQEVVNQTEPPLAKILGQVSLENMQSEGSPIDLNQNSNTMMLTSRVNSGSTTNPMNARDQFGDLIEGEPNIAALHGAFFRGEVKEGLPPQILEHKKIEQQSMVPEPTVEIERSKGNLFLVYNHGS